MNEPRHTARAIILHEDKMLLIERWRDGLHYFSIPGGGIEVGETAEEAVLREIVEETSCRVELSRKLYRLTFASGSNADFFLCQYISGTPHLPIDSEEAQKGPDNRFEPAWLPLEKLATAPFLVWEPIRQRLIYDLEHGFDDEIVKLTSDMVR